MNHTPHNLYENLPVPPAEEEILTLLRTRDVQIERIVSNGKASPQDFWYDQPHDEWVILLQGTAILEFGNGNITALKTGDHLLLPRHSKHRVNGTSTDAIWLAVYIKEE
jgi:cupin 2 domain-containing protein